MKYILALTTLLVLSACGGVSTPSQSSIQTAIALTQQALPTQTQNPTSTETPTQTPMPTSTSTPTPSQTPTPTSTSTPTFTPTPTPTTTPTPTDLPPTQTAVAQSATQTASALSRSSTATVAAEARAATTTAIAQSVYATDVAESAIRAATAQSIEATKQSVQATQQAIAEYKEIPEQQLITYPLNHVGEKLKVRGQVFNVMANDKFQMWVLGTYDAVVVITDDNFSDLYKNDVITVYGEMYDQLACGTNSYGAEVCQPYLVKAFYVK